MRYFRSSVAAYESICAQLDAAYGYPNLATKTLRALPLAASLPTDIQGRVYLQVTTAQCEYILPSQILPSLLESGMIEEVDEHAYNLAAGVDPMLDE